jgi:fructose-1,6-bisphosphatase I
LIRLVCFFFLFLFFLFFSFSNGRFFFADGSSNIDVNVTIGTIFGIFRRNDFSKRVSKDDVLLAGNKMVAAGYCMYGSATMMVLSTGEGVNGFTLDPTSGEFVLTHKNLKIPVSRTIYSANEGNARFWGKATRDYVQHIKFDADKPYSLRYIGSMVGDVHRTLLYGGIFMYPADSRAPAGKLRLLYEVQPMGFIIAQAGGIATTGMQDVLDIVPTDIHQRSPVYCGSKGQVELLQQYFANNE